METKKAYPRRLAEGFLERYCQGQGIDIGCSDDPIFPHVVCWDKPQGDATVMAGVADETFDFVHSSHCLEHIDHSITALRNWFRILKTGGYLILLLPHQHLYERRKQLPSLWNPDHRRFYTPASLLQEIERALPVNGYRIRVFRDCDAGFPYERMLPSAPPEGEFSIEVVLQKIKAPSWVIP